MAYTPEQRQNIQTIKRIARQRGASARVTKALLEAASVESNFRNLNYGDRDSKGILQQRPSQGWGAPGSVEQDVNDFLDRALKVNRGFRGSAGQLAQAVQRSAFPGRYDQRSREVSRLLGSTKGGGSAGGGTAGVPGTTSVSYTPGTDNSTLRTQLKAQYLLNRNNPDALGQLIAGLQGAQDTPGQYSERITTPSAGGRAPLPTGGKVAQYKAAADLLDAAKLPYKWGGGHGKKLKLLKGAKPIPVDCSGAVSAVLGIDPRVSGEFAKWGQEGKGKNVTIYANGEHVLMEINGHFFGTSKSNPGGGAGWIPRSKISKAYLSRFVARHPPGL